MTEHRNLISLIRYFLPCLQGIRGRWVQAALLLAQPSLFGAGLLWAGKLLQRSRVWTTRAGSAIAGTLAQARFSEAIAPR
jgi:hypothetical protein